MKIKVSAGLNSSNGSEEESVRRPSELLAAARNPWCSCLVDTSLQILTSSPSLCVCAQIYFFSFFKSFKKFLLLFLSLEYDCFTMC